MTGIRKTLSRVLLVATVGAGLVSCGVVPYRTARNDPLCEETRATGQAPALDSNCKLISGAGPLTRFPVSRARREFSGSDTDLPPAFVGLALSGGGSRAANFSMAVMQELQSIGVMQHVTAISSTSGGGLAGAYYALKGPDLDWPQARERMGRNFLGRWLGSQALPHHLISTSFTHEDRSDLMADIFDSNLFDEATFASLGAFGPGRPIFLANATDLATGGRFTFDDGTFHSRLSSRLDTFPIAQAVMASAAFPGAFNSVTLRRYPMPAMPAASGAQRPPVPVGYQHLIDGGPTDNLGVEALVELAASHRAALAAAGKPLPEAGCLVIVVDAYASGIANRKAWTADPRGLLDHVVDFNFLDSVDALLARRRQDLLSFLGLGTSRPPATGTSLGDFAQWGKVPNLFGFTLGPAEQWVQFDVPEGFRSGVHSWAEIRPVLRQTAPFPSPERAELNRTGQLGKPTQLAKGHFRCAAWHLNLGGLLAIRLYAGQAGEEPHRLPNDDSGHTHPVLMQRAKLHWLVSQIETSFKLTGPDGCSSQFLQEALYAAAFVAVREDHKNRLLACDWFDKAKLALPPSCRAFPGNESTRLVLDLEPVGPLVAERYGNEQVACRNAGSGAP